ncbi:acyltransferase domain-containing protein [Streptomyces sp. NPDC001118]
MASIRQAATHVAGLPHPGRLVTDVQTDIQNVGVPLDDVRRAQPLIFALDVALGTLLLSWGVRPAAYLGHSAGEYAVAVLAGLGGCAGVYGRIHRPARHWTHPRPPSRCTARLRQLARRHEPASAAPSLRDQRVRWGRSARIAAVTAA